MIKNFFITFILNFAALYQANAFDFNAAEIDIECPAGPERQAGDFDALGAAPCELFPIQSFNNGEAMTMRCSMFAESLKLNCSNDVRSDHRNLDCLSTYYNGTREENEIKFSENGISRNHLDRTSQIYNTYKRMIEEQASFAANTNNYGISRLEGFENEETNPVKDFSCDVYDRNEFRNTLMSCSNASATNKLHKYLSLVEGKNSFNGLEQMIRDRFLITLQDNEGGVRNSLSAVESMQTSTFVNEVKFLKQSPTARNFYLTSSEMSSPDTNVAMSFLSFRRDYGDNIGAMERDVRNIMNKRYRELKATHEVGSDEDTFGIGGFPSQADFNIQRNTYIEELKKKYRVMMILNDVVEAAVIPAQTGSLESSLRSASQMRNQLQASINQHNITVDDLDDTGWFNISENNHVDFDKDFLDYLQNEIQFKVSKNNLDDLRTISGTAELWYRFQHAQLSSLNNSCNTFKSEVENLCNAIESNNVLMTDVAAESCLENDQGYTHSSVLEFIHHRCAGENGFHVDASIPETPAEFYQTIITSQESLANDPRARGGRSGMGAEPPPGFERSGGLISTTNSDPRGPVPTAMGNHYTEQAERRNDPAIRARERINTSFNVNGRTTLTDIVDNSENNRVANRNGFFQDFFDNNETDRAESMDQSAWDFLTRSTGDTTEEGEEDVSSDELIAETEDTLEDLESEIDDEKNSMILDRINELEEQLAKTSGEVSEVANPITDPRVTALMKEIEEQRAELERLRAERQRRNEATVTRPSRTVASDNERTRIVRNQPRVISAPEQNNVAENLGESIFPDVSPLADRGTAAPVQVNAYGDYSDNTTLYAGVNPSYTSSSLILTSNNVVELAQIPSDNIVTSSTDTRLINLRPGEVIYLQVDNGIYIKHEKNSAGEIITQEVRLKRDKTRLAENVEVRPFEEKKPNIGRVIVRLEAIEKEAGL